MGAALAPCRLPEERMALISASAGLALPPRVACGRQAKRRRQGRGPKAILGGGSQRRSALDSPTGKRRSHAFLIKTVCRV